MTTFTGLLSGRRRDCRCPIARHAHGTRGAFLQDNCRCMECRLAYARVAAVYRAGGRWPEVDWAPAVGARRRLQALATIGYSATTLATSTGITASRLQNIRTDTKHPRIRPETWVKVTEAYDSVWDKPITTVAGRRCATWARRSGYVPPLAWDDDSIDDPSASPNVDAHASPGGATFARPVVDVVAVEEAMRGRAIPLTLAERREAVRQLTAAGRSASVIAERLSTYPRQVTRDRASGHRQRAHGYQVGAA